MKKSDTINMLREHFDTVDTKIEPKEEQRGCSRSNDIDGRCSSLCCNLTFSETAVDSFIELARLLKKVHIRLVMQGYVIEDGKFIPPEKHDDSNIAKSTNG